MRRPRRDTHERKNHGPTAASRAIADGVSPRPEPGCCKLQEQCFCCNAAFAFPCDDEVPCMISILGLTMVKDYKFVCQFGGKMDAEVEVIEGNKA